MPATLAELNCNWNCPKAKKCVLPLYKVFRECLIVCIPLSASISLFNSRFYKFWLNIDAVCILMHINTIRGLILCKESTRWRVGMGSHCAMVFYFLWATLHRFVPNCRSSVKLQIIRALEHIRNLWGILIFTTDVRVRKLIIAPRVYEAGWNDTPFLQGLRRVHLRV